MFGKSLIQRNDSERRRELTNPLTTLQQDINQLFHMLWSGCGGETLPEAFGKVDAGTYFPRVNVSETESEVRVTAEIPGVDEKDLDVSVDRSTLTIRGEKKAEDKSKAGNFYRLERSYGSFERTVPLPAEVVTEKVAATFANGVLTVSLPKRAEARGQLQRVKVRTA